MIVRRKASIEGLLGRLSRRKIASPPASLSGGTEGPPGKEGPAGKEGAKGEQGLTGSGTINCRLATAVALAAYTRSTNVLTANANGALATIDGVAPAVNDFILLKNGAAGADNGVYKVASLGSGLTKWTMERIPSLDTSAECVPGMLVTVAEGTTNADSVWQLTTNAPITLNTTALTFEFLKRAGQYGCSVRRTANQKIANNTDTAVIYDTAEYNDGATWSAGNPTRFTNTSGQPRIVLLTAGVRWTAGEGRHALYARVNGNANKRYIETEISKDAVTQGISVIVRLEPNDYLEVMVWQNSGAERELEKDQYGTSFQACRASFEVLR